MKNLKYTELLSANKSFNHSESAVNYSIAILSNVIVNSIKEIIDYGCKLEGVKANISFGNYDNIIQDLSQYKHNNLIILFYELLNIVDSLNFDFENSTEDEYSQLKNKLFEEIKFIFSSLSESDAVIFNLFSKYHYNNTFYGTTKLDRFVEELNTFIIQNAPPNFHIIDINKVFVSEGLSYSIDSRFFRIAKAPYSYQFFRRYFTLIRPIILRHTGKLKKALIFDCDNTLWSGILGEDGFKNIDMNSQSKKGAIFCKIQKLALNLSKKGIIIGLCSKNNEEDVFDVINNHPDFLLKEENIVIYKVNWNDKASNIKEIAKELNIGLDSIVFVDDSPFEISLVNDKLKDVMTFQVPKDLNEYFFQLEALVYENFNLRYTKEDEIKSKLYKQLIQSKREESSYDNISDYLSSLGIEISVCIDDLESFERIAQLTQKTNQFNLTTKRYTETNIKDFILSDKSIVFSMSVSDKFGSNGITGVCICHIDANEEDCIHIDSFLMSCRIIGRNIEHEFFGIIATHLKELKFRELNSEYLFTPKNAQVENFYKNVGMIETYSSKSKKRYKLNLDEYEFVSLSYIKSEVIKIK